MTPTFITEMLFLAEGLFAGAGLTLSFQAIARSRRAEKKLRDDA